MNFLKKFEQKMNRFAIGGIINYVCAMLAMGTVLYLVAPGFLNYLILNPIAIMHGQVWRILTFFVYPPAFTGGNPMGYILFNALAIYCIRSFGMIVEQVWGKFRFNCYIILGVLLNVAASLFMYLVVGFPMVLTPVYLVYSFFFVFALMFPDMQVLLMMVLPLKAKWIAYAEAAVYIYYFVKGDIYTRVQIFASCTCSSSLAGWCWPGRPVTNRKSARRISRKRLSPWFPTRPAISALCAAGRTRTARAWNSVIVQNVKAVTNTAWIICIHIST